jgi:hypothetical protein
MNCSYFLRIFWCCLWGIMFEGSKFQFRKNSVRPTRQCQKLIWKKITIACPTDKGNAGRLTIIANKCSIVRMPLSNECASAPATVVLYPSSPTSAPLSEMPLTELICIRPGTPTPTRFFFPDLSSTVATRPSFPTAAHMSHYADSSGGACAKSRVQGCQSSRNHLPGLWYGSGGRRADVVGS